jgi:hypothetical protein
MPEGLGTDELTAAGQVDEGVSSGASPPFRCRLERIVETILVPGGVLLFRSSMMQTSSPSVNTLCISTEWTPVGGPSEPAHVRIGPRRGAERPDQADVLSDER